MDNLTIMTVNQLAKEVNLRKDKYQNINEIKKCLIELKNKNAIDFESEGLKNQSPLEIVFKNKEYYQNLNGFVRGYEQIPFPLFDLARNSEEFYVLCLLKKNEKLKREIAYSTLASLLGICDKSAKTLISNMVNAGLVNRESGQFYRNSENQWRQEINKYEIPENEMKESNVVEMFTEQTFSSSNSEGINNLIDWGNWKRKEGIGKYANLTEQDYFLYEFQKDMDTEFREHCDKRIDALKKAGFKFNKWEQSAKNNLHDLINREEMIMKKKEEMQEHVRINNLLKEKRKTREARRVGKKSIVDSGFDIKIWFDDEAIEGQDVG